MSADGGGTVDSVASTEDQIRAATVGEPRRIDGPIVLADYDPEWPQLFERERRRITACLGERVLLLEHTGSTSVPGLCAKPIIDMLLVVADSGDEPSYVSALAAEGYAVRIREPHWHEHRVLKGPDTDVNLHVFTAGSTEIERILAFRDRLRGDAEERELYARTKRELAQRRWAYVQNYADAKTPVVEAIIARALADRGAANIGGSPVASEG